MTTPHPTRRRDSIVIASLWMVALAILLGWIPVIGPAIAGFVGGRRAGSAGGAFVAGILPAIVIGILVGVILALFDVPLLGAVTGVAVVIWIAIEAIPLLVAAVVGGWLEET